jgi:hypothetical protein
MHEGFRKSFGQATGAIVAGGTITFPSLSLPSTPALDDLSKPPEFDEITVFVAVQTTGPIADLALTAAYTTQPIKNGPGAAFALTPSGVSVIQTVPSCPGAGLSITVTSGGAAAHTLLVAYGAHAAPGFVEDLELAHLAGKQ